MTFQPCRPATIKLLPYERAPSGGPLFLVCSHLVVGKDGVILPQDHMPRGAGLVQVDDALVAGPAEPQADIVLILHEIPVHQYVDVLQQLVGHLAATGAGLQNFRLIMVAGIAPNGLLGEQYLYILYKGQQFPLVLRFQRLAPQQRKAVDVLRLQAFQDLVADLLGKRFAIMEIPRHRIETVGAVAPAAGDKQAGAHALAVGDVAVLDGCVIHTGQTPLVDCGAPISCGAGRFRPYGHPQYTSFAAAPQAPGTFQVPFFHRCIAFLYTSSQIYQKTGVIFVTQFLDDGTPKSEYFVYSCFKTTISCGFVS